MLGFPIVDTHLHLWDLAQLSYPWLGDEPVLNRSYLPQDYRQACGSHDVEKMVFVQCECDPAQYRAEADWVTVLAKEDPRIGGLVVWAPLEKGEAVVPELTSLAANKLVRGIRRVIQFEPDRGFCLQPGFIRGVQMLAEFNLSFDICISHDQMGNTIQLVQRCPNTRFILDHIGKPDIKRQVFEPWKTQLKTLSDLPNTWCKVSGLVVEAERDRWKPADLRPYLDHVLDCFGFDRVMFGGDWPVVLLATELSTWITTLADMTSANTDDEKHKLFHDNAVSFYRLEG